MKSVFYPLLIAYCLSNILIGCDKRDCINKNPVFDQYAPETKQYKDALVKQLNRVDPTTVTYIFDKYLVQDGQEYFSILIQGEGFCAKTILKVTQWHNIENIRRTKGISYSGAELKNLTFDIYQDSVKTEFLYRDLSRIID